MLVRSHLKLKNYENHMYCYINSRGCMISSLVLVLTDAIYPRPQKVTPQIIWRESARGAFWSRYRVIEQDCQL